ncbi:MAG TPA: 1-(5-phosphoribosyl)-5-amino-4-imidazole-carboxylate carboxylase, partial [Tepidisphaeraceae bacterium]|nr:1-(5-phosphoribosyl)-5-amino-4-imidazole-carboxylate carboxylase [Tepidisphaeraceae bacterium]
MLNEQTLRNLLTRVAQREQGVDDALAALRVLPFEEVDGFAKIDHHRDLRRGFPEVVYCAGKTPEQTAAIMERLADKASRVLGTRAPREHFDAAVARVPDLKYDETARVIYLDRRPDEPRREGVILAAAGTSDLPVAEEAARTLDLMGHAVTRLYDIGVAGLHRLLHHLPVLRKANVV